MRLRLSSQMKTRALYKKQHHTLSRTMAMHCGCSGGRARAEPGTSSIAPHCGVHALSDRDMRTGALTEQRLEAAMWTYCHHRVVVSNRSDLHRA